METYKIYAAGRFADTPEKLQIRRPYDRHVFAETGLAGLSDLENAIQAGLEAENIMQDLPAYKRSLILHQVAEGIQSERERFAWLLCQEAGKPLRFALAEIDRAIQTYRIASEEAKRIPGEFLQIDWTPVGEGKEGWIRYFPVGLVGAISPFNFPMNLSAHKIAPAIAAGNPVILKPASQTPVTVLELARVFDQTDLPKGALSIMPMTRETGSRLVTDSRIKLLTFTGSPEVGWRMKDLAGKKKVVLELGGNAGVLIGDSADWQAAVRKCLVGGYSYSGQVCIHVQRIYVVDKLFREFSDQFASLVSQLKSGDPLDLSTDISVMIDEENAIRVENWVKEAEQSGARIICGGRRNGPYFEPTVISGTDSSMKVNCCEIFGPVVILESVSSFEEGIQKINDSGFGLQAGVFTNNLEEMNMAFKQLKVGGVIVNDVPTFRVDHMPYGGIKDSGFGREGVKYAMFDMMEPKLLVKNR